MNAFVACAKCCATTIVCAIAGFKLFSILWTLSLGLESSKIAALGLRFLDPGTTLFIGLVAGLFARFYERAHSYTVAAISAALVETLHASIGGGLVHFPAKSLVSVNVAVASALAAAWIATRIARATSKRGTATPKTPSPGTLS